jgi:hypothetical protein
LKYLDQIGYEPYICESEEEARSLAKTLPLKKKWPCFFTTSDTTGEKDFEEFFTANEVLDLARFNNFGIIKNQPLFKIKSLDKFIHDIHKLKLAREWTKEEIVTIFNNMINNFEHKETGKYLDGKM